MNNTINTPKSFIENILEQCSEEQQLLFKRTCGNKNEYLSNKDFIDQFDNETLSLVASDVLRKCEDYIRDEKHNEQIPIEKEYYTKDEVISLCKNSFSAGSMFCATENKVYEQSDNIDVWLKKNIN